MRSLHKVVRRRKMCRLHPSTSSCHVEGGKVWVDAALSTAEVAEMLRHQLT